MWMRTNCWWSNKVIELLKKNFFFIYRSRYKCFLLSEGIRTHQQHRFSYGEEKKVQF